jgi:D-alanine-D-alanine ligase
MVCQALRERGHRVAFLDMFLGLEGYEKGTKDLFEAPIPEHLRAVSKTAPDLDKIRLSRQDTGKSLFGPGVLDLCQKVDMVFLALHGACGEDGRVQAAFDLMGIPYTGSGYLGSAIAMDKDYTKRFITGSEILTPNWKTVSYDKTQIDSLKETLELPCVIKVLRSGSSLGVFIVKDRNELEQALGACLQYDSTIMVEQYIEGKEFTCGILEECPLPTVEIIPQVEFYDYESKYQPGATLEICPGRTTPEIEEKIRQTALRVHKALGLTVYSRSDFIVDAKGNVYFLEVNTLPGMTPTSLVPQEAAAMGIEYGELCERIIAASKRAREH